MKNKLVAAVLTLAFCLNTGAHPESSRSPAARSELFWAARDAIDNANWTVAEANLREYLRKYGASESADAAMYYLAFCLRKQGHLREADQVLQQLVTQHPRSAWRPDAETMRVEIVRGAAAAELTLRGLQAEDDRTRAVAVRNLFRENAAQGKAECVKVVNAGNARMAAFCLEMLLQTGDPAATEVISDAARTAAIPEVRATAIKLLGELPNNAGPEMLTNVLLKDLTRASEVALYAVYTDHEWVDEHFLRNIVEYAKGDWVRGAAMLLLGSSRAAGSVPLIASVAEKAENRLLQKFALDALWRHGSGEARARLEGIARASVRVDVQAAARYYVAAPAGPEAANALVRWYDAEEIEDIRMNILVLLARTQTHEATQKLGAVLKHDTSPRLQAQAEALLQTGHVKIPMPLGQPELPMQSVR